jgi:hypothetical protein
MNCGRGIALTLGVEVIGQWAGQAALEIFGNRSAESPIDDWWSQQGETGKAGVDSQPLSPNWEAS